MFPAQLGQESGCELLTLSDLPAYSASAQVFIFFLSRFNFLSCELPRVVFRENEVGGKVKTQAVSVLQVPGRPTGDQAAQTPGAVSRQLLGRLSVNRSEGPTWWLLGLGPWYKQISLHCGLGPTSGPVLKTQRKRW